MKTRFNLISVVPHAYKPLFEFDKILVDTEMDHIHREMISELAQVSGWEKRARVLVPFVWT